MAGTYGKARKFVNSVNYGNGATDPIRNILGVNWFDKMEIADDFSGMDSRISSIVFGESEATQNYDLNQTRTSVRIVGDIDVLIDQTFNPGAGLITAQQQDTALTTWEEFLQTEMYNVAFNNEYEDYAFDELVPAEETRTSEVSSELEEKTATVEMIYNYYQKDWETGTGTTSQQETALPNFYAFVSEAVEGEVLTFENKAINDPDHAEFMANLTANGALSEDMLGRVNASGESHAQSYFKSYGRTVSSANDLADIADRFSMLLVPKSSVNLLTDYNYRSDLFPWYADIRFSTDDSEVLATAIEDSSLYEVLLKDMGEAWRGAENPATPVDAPFTYLKETDESSTLMEQAELKTFGLYSWLNAHQLLSPTSFGTQGIFLGSSQSDSAKMATSESSIYEKQLALSIFLGKLSAITNNNNYHRTPEQIYRGDMSYSDVLAYRIVKYRGGPSGQTSVVGSATPILTGASVFEGVGTTATEMQSIWIPNEKDLDMVSYLDTQIRYNQEYTYEIFAYVCVLGESITYENLSKSVPITSDCVEFVDFETGEIVEPRVPGLVTATNPITGDKKYITIAESNIAMAEFDIVTSTSPIVIEIPYYQTRGTVLDKPPLPPHVSPYPFVGVPNRFGFLLEGAIGELTMDPVYITSDDQTMATAIREARYLSADDPITYGTDDYPVEFQMFRLTEAPTSYSSFAVGRVSTHFSQLNIYNSDEFSTSMEIVDDIEPNTKYYYMFRTIDVHGHASNPSPVYQVEIAQSEEIVIPYVKVLKEFANLVPTAPTKSFRRFLQLEPSALHQIINEEKNDFASYSSARDLVAGQGGSIILGEADKSVWDKKFKIRLTSKKTGKKLDINLVCKSEHVTTELDSLD